VRGSHSCPNDHDGVRARVSILRISIVLGPIRVGAFRGVRATDLKTNSEKGDDHLDNFFSLFPSHSSQFLISQPTLAWFWSVGPRFLSLGRVTTCLVHRQCPLCVVVDVSFSISPSSRRISRSNSENSPCESI
jgi:hypothetical protein